MKTIRADDVRTLAQKPEIRAYIDYAIAHDDGGLIVVGWLYDPHAQVTGFSLLLDGKRTRFNRRTYDLVRLVHGAENIYLERVPRPDVGEAMQDPGSGSGQKYGFVLILGQADEANRLAFETADGGAVAVPINPLTDAVEISCALEVIRPHSGEALVAGCKAVFGNDDLLSGVQRIPADASGWQTALKKFSTVDHVMLIDGRYLLINGWIALAGDELESVTLATRDARVDVTDRIRRYMRQDLVPAYPWSAASVPLGFMCLFGEQQRAPDSVMITVRARSGEQQTHECAVSQADWNMLSRLICDHSVDFSLAAIELLDQQVPGADSESFKAGLAAVRRNNMHAKYGCLGSFVENADYVFASIDRAYPLGADGLLLFGWYLDAGRKLESIKVYDEEGHAVTVRLTSLLRRDVTDAYREQFPKASPLCGFACLVPVATRAGELRVLGFDFGDSGETWLKIPADRPALSGINLAREMIGMIPEPMGMSQQLYELFDSALGPAIESVTRNHNAGSVDVSARQFGVMPEQADCSVIVPLYGRCDFMRYQLSHFANDPEFAHCDLVYVVDDPELVSDALTLAARYQPLFGIPFRVLWYGENRGFAGANNIGVQHAVTDYVVLMNSDVLPQHPGWLGKLRQALDSLEGAGVVGPLLEFDDGSIQHAGMRPVEDDSLPGFLLNTHVQMGTCWEGGDQPVEQVMLTAACMMLSRENYLSVGGLDEGYLVGDFEDSDLCLSLRKSGHRLWLVPEARLWHLERQSVSLYGGATARQLITLYNGWRYRQKILSGELVDPTGVEVAQ